MQEETRKWVVGERKESLQWSLINFPFHPRNPRTLQSMKTVTTIILLCHRLEKWQPPETQSDLSSACNILLVIHHFHSYSFARITSNETVCFEGWNKFSVRIWYPENQIGHTDNSYVSHRRRKRFSSSAGLLFGVSSAITDRTRHLAIRASCFYVSVKIRGRLGLLSISFDFRIVIFQPVVFPFVWAKYKWKFMRDRCKLSLPWCHTWRGLFCSPK